MRSAAEQSPNEGAALAIAIMEAIYHSGALLIATTTMGNQTVCY